MIYFDSVEIIDHLATVFSVERNCENLIKTNKGDYEEEKVGIDTF